MKLFAHLFKDLDETNSTNEKVEVLTAYLAAIPDKEKVYALALFTGRRPKRMVSPSLLRFKALELTGIPEWLFEECYSVIGDLGEAISLLLPEGTGAVDRPLSVWMEEIAHISRVQEEAKMEWISSAWSSLTRQECFVLNKILTGSFRLGVSHVLVVRALSNLTGIATDILMHRLSGEWTPKSLQFSSLLHEGIDQQSSRPYPFCLAYAVEDEVSSLGDESEWQAEWKWDGIRCQVINRMSQVFVWSRGEELITENFPELASFAGALPEGTVLDGELLCMENGRPLPFQLLQTRISRKNVSVKVLSSCPAGFVAYDLLEYKGEDMRKQPLSLRRSILESIHSDLRHKVFFISEKISYRSWEDLTQIRARSRDEMAEGIMLKRLHSVYGTGRKKGDWWKWKIEPYAVDGVLIYAQKGHGRRADLYTDYTFAVWDQDKLVPFAKAYSGLTDKEIAEVDRFVKANTLERFGPVRTVKPELVFEIGFEGIGASSRHKSGIAIRFPRMLRWRKDKTALEADTLENLKILMQRDRDQRTP